MSLDDIKNIMAQFGARRRRLQIFYDYVEGRQRLNFASIKFKNKFGQRLESLVDNICPTVINAPASRLEIINFAPENADEAISQDAWKIWQRSRMPAKEKALYREALKTGAAYVIVWADSAGNARIWPQVSRDIYVVRNEEGRVVEANKLFYDTSTRRINLTRYYADRIEKYESDKELSPDDAVLYDSLRFRPREVPGERFPLINPYGAVPVFELEMPDGRSFLDDAIPIQDVINKNLCDLMVAGEYNSLRQRWAAGIQFEIDQETGKPVIPFEYDDQLWASSSETGRFGEFSNASLADYLNALADARGEVARITGIPLHWFDLTSGQFPSGAALRNAESRFISLITELQLNFGAEMADMMAFAYQVERKSTTSPVAFSVQWQQASPPATEELLQNALIKKQLGVSERRILEELGYTQSDIETILAQKLDEERQNAEASARIFNAGLIQ